ncbi:hypothetical protein CBER1_05062 [Cercospora berteroae]|uniref:Uncharacterized protein n=1 Tax=Cercospora berteroae TaxID=357750 RepID=A0A2S6BRJ2_9PEZI|nr:hypothetical protein CBER1_05062 [Cercospora berteroae]
MLFSTHLVRAVLAVFPLTVDHVIAFDVLELKHIQLALPAVPDGIEGLEGYNFEPLQWEVRAFFSDGPLIPMNGTVQGVMAKLRELNPDFDEPITPDHNDTLRTRANIWDGSGYDCERGSTQGAVVGRIDEGIAYLRRLRGTPRTGPGSGNFGKGQLQLQRRYRVV